MSWQRILRFAKIRQVPVIITDETGEDPMILLSLDQLEQALDGNVGPDIPPPTPAPRSTTPAFVPEETATFSEEVLEEVIAQTEPVDSLELIKVMVPPIAPAIEPELERVLEPEIVTPIAVEPPRAGASLEEESKASPQASPQAPTAEMSLEERFFLEY